MKCGYLIFIISIIIAIGFYEFADAYKFHATLKSLKPTTSDETQERAVYGLLERLIPERANKFLIKIDSSFGPHNRDTFHIEKLGNDTIKIIGSSGVAAATGFHHYLKYYCFCHVSWEVVNLNLPNILPDVNLTATSNDRFRYYQNVCTTSYSFVWWNWTDWERHIDWIVLNSYNLVLAFNGQEAIWKRVYQKLNLTAGEIDEHFTGPAFLSWGRMGNIRGWGGPLTNAWHQRSLTLQHQILKRMREFGVTPVLPAFAGHVPRAFKRLFPNARMTITETWNDFGDAYCCPYLLDPTDPLFKTVGNLFLKELIAEFGTNHAYSCDTFNEMRPSSGNVKYLSEMGKSVYAAMEDVDSKAVWIMQNWLFVHDFLFWSIDRAKALLTSVPLGKMIVLDLQSEQFPQYRRFQSYYGQPYIWCMLHNFGGTLGMFGSVDVINKNVFLARSEPNNTLVGTGLTPEGINQNYVLYDLMNEMGWRKEPANLTEWFGQYAQRRYGREDQYAFDAWQIFKSTVYNFTGLQRMRGKYAINRRPSTKISTWTWYDSCDFFQGWDLFLQSAKNLQNCKGYLHDLVDTTRQVLQILGDQYYRQLIADFKKKDISAFQDGSALFLELVSDLEKILATNKAFLLGQWLNSAKNAASNDDEARLYEYNAKNQITLWGPNGEIMDYANKQWSGVASDFFLPRWSLFITSMNNSLNNKTPFDESGTASRIFKQIEKQFTFDRTIYPDKESGDAIKVAQYIREKWWTKKHCRYARSEENDAEEPLEDYDLIAMYIKERENPEVYVIN